MTNESDINNCLDEFDVFIDTASNSPLIAPLIDTMDTASGVVTWFKSHNIELTAKEIFKFTELILKQKANK